MVAVTSPPASLPEVMSKVKDQAPFSQCARPNRRFEFNKRSQLFIRVHNVTLSVIAMHINH